MEMKNKEQLLYFFLQGKISLSQYDYKFMANLQTMIQNKHRVTSNQATLFDNLISKYKKQLIKNNFDKDILKALPWKTPMVESTPEYTGALVSVDEDQLVIRVPFNKQFITYFRTVKNNTFSWSTESKTYTTAFSTNALKIAYTSLPKYFNTVRYDDTLQKIIDELDQYKNFVWEPTLTKVNGTLLIAALNSVLGDLVKDMELELTPKVLFKLSMLGINIDPSLYEDNEKLKFASNTVYEVEYLEVENIIGWMKNIGCDNVLIGRGLRNRGIEHVIEKYGMQPLGPMNYGMLPEGITMLIQHITNIDVRNNIGGLISKTVVLKDSRPIEVQ